MLEAETWRINHTPMSAKRKVASRSASRKEPATVATTTTATSRLYVAPSASKSIRRIDSGTCAVDKAVSARRRRNLPAFSSPGPHHHYIDDSDHESSDSLIDNLEAPCLWMSDDLEEGSTNKERLNNSFRSLGSLKGTLTGHKPTNLAATSTHTTPQRSASRSSRKTKSAQHQRRRRYKSSRSDDSLRSDHDGDEASVYSFYTQHSTACESVRVSSDYPEFHDHLPSRTKQKAARSLWQVRKLHNLWHHTSLKWILLHLILISAFVWVVHDAKKRQALHQTQLQQYEEERAHILEQMTWIDAAAKRVHQKYSALGGLADHQALLQQHEETKAELKQEKNELVQILEQMQHRVQQNARHRTVQYFGDRPVQVSLPLLEQDRHIVIALQDDAPHAVSSFLQQVHEKVWDVVDFQRLQHGRILQVSSRLANTDPILEFSEPSRGCHQVGGVAVHQLESTDFHVLVLKIHMEEHAVMEDGDVCIGTVIVGLEALEQMIPVLPEIRSEEMAEYDGHEDYGHEENNPTYGTAMGVV